MPRQEMEYSSDALKIGLTVVIDCAMKAMKQSGKDGASFPCEFEGHEVMVSVVAVKKDAP